MTAVNKLAPKSSLFQYKVSLPEIGSTIVYASNPAELRQKLRLLINYRYRGDISIERILLVMLVSSLWIKDRSI